MLNVTDRGRSLVVRLRAQARRAQRSMISLRARRAVLRSAIAAEARDRLELNRPLAFIMRA